MRQRTTQKPQHTAKRSSPWPWPTQEMSRDRAALAAPNTALHQHGPQHLGCFSRRAARGEGDSQQHRNINEAATSPARLLDEAFLTVQDEQSRAAVPGQTQQGQGLAQSRVNGQQCRDLRSRVPPASMH